MKNTREITESLSISTILYEANKLGLLVWNQETSVAYHKHVNQALQVIHALDPFNPSLLGCNDPVELTIDSLNMTTEIPSFILSKLLRELIKLEIVQNNNGYYSLIPF